MLATLQGSCRGCADLTRTIRGQKRKIQLLERRECDCPKPPTPRQKRKTAAEKLELESLRKEKGCWNGDVQRHKVRLHAHLISKIISFCLRITYILSGR
jgi:hypothetical protein